MSNSSSNLLDVLANIRPTKACVNCRKQKMKCEVEDGETVCKRCKSSKTDCIFRPRANAAALKELTKPPPTIVRTSSKNGWTDELRESMLSRLDALEAFLGFREHVESDRQSPPSSAQEQQSYQEPTFAGVWQAALTLQRITRSPHNSKIWTKSVVKDLWLFFHTNTPGLHFLSKNRTSSEPTPLLLASILYVGALHHTSAEMAALAPDFFIATCSAIAELSVYPALSIPKRRPSVSSPSGGTLEKTERTTFENVLGLLLASLVSEGFIEATGLWISLGYRLTLDHCPVTVDRMSRDWGGIFSGLQIVDLEHASLHLTCPLVPIKAPLASLSQLQQTAPDPFYPLTKMMHSGLSRFTGRGLPCIWSYIVSNDTSGQPATGLNFTEEDGKVMREWAACLDQWLIKYNQPTNSVNENIVIFRQYSLHRLFVLSIYLPARGFDIFANNVASVERRELLISARTTLKLQMHDKGIWSNWDLAMITWAALIILQAIEGGAGEDEDFHTIQSHLNLLQGTLQPEPSLRHHLASRLESALQSMHTPPTLGEDAILTDVDPNWMIFDENSIRLASEQLFTQQQQTPSGNIAEATVDNFTTHFYDEYGLDIPTDAWSGNLMRVFGNTDTDNAKTT